MAIKICDAIMGSGKSSAAISYMNEHPEQKFIYITPYLEEGERIKSSCPALNFKAPSEKLKEFGFKKYTHTLSLLDSGENVVSTHNMFLRYTDDMVKAIKEHNYMLIIDEAMEIFRQADIRESDVKIMEDAGWITKENRTITINPTFEYTGGVFNEIVSFCRGNRLVDMSDLCGGVRMYYWLYSKEVLQAFKDIYVLTYMFRCQTMRYYFDMLNLTYENIGISKDIYGKYHFSDTFDYLPEYTKTLSSKIHIFDNAKLNSIGNNKNSLSHTWYDRASCRKETVETLRKNVYNYFTNYHRDKSSERRLWASYKNGEKFVRGKGFYHSNLAFNTKATNDYSSRDVLAYCVNIYMQPLEKQYFLSMGVDICEDEYALSVMIQWIWRSAIRNGKEIWIYIPSKRMRTLLKNWISQVEQDYIHKKENPNND